MYAGKQHGGYRRGSDRRALSVSAYDDGNNGTEVNIIANYDPVTQGPVAIGTTPYVKVTLRAVKPSYFIQLVYPAPLAVTTSGVGYCLAPGDSLLPHDAIVSLRPQTGNCNSNPNDASFNWNGTAYLEVNNSGVFVNSNDPACAMRIQSNSTTVSIDGSCNVVGDVQDRHTRLTCTGGTTHPTTQWDLNPLSDRDKPDDACDLPIEDAPSSGNVTPGHYALFDPSPHATMTLLPGFYCVEEVDYQNGTLAGDGVVIYMPPQASGYPNERWSTNGNSEMELYAPNATNCEAGNTCDWIDLLLWVDIPWDEGCAGPDPCNGDIHINGGNASLWRGTIYAPGSACTLEGHGTGFGITTQFICWGFRGEGTSNLTVNYEQPEFLQTPPSIGFAE
jgi:hypothetical protein